MQTKFYFLLAALVGFSSFSGKLVAQSACFGYGSEPSPQAGYQLLVEEYMTFDGSEAQPALAALAGQTTYRVYLKTPGAGDFVSAVMADGVTGTGEVHLNTTTTFYKNQFGGLTPNQINPLLFSYFPALEYDSFVTIGLDQEAVGSSQGDIMLLNEGEWGPQFLSGGDLDIDASVAVAGGGWFVLGAASNGFAGEDNKVLLAQLTTTGELSGSLNVQIFPEDGGSNAAFTHQFSFTSELCGCTDASADNYVPTATIDDGSCEYFGCMDSSACNFDSGANVDDGSCDYCCAQVTSTNENYSVDVELFDAGGINGLRTYRVYVHTSSELDALSAVAGYESSPAHVSTTTSFFQVPAPSGGVTPNALNPIFLEFLPDLEFDSYVTIGLSSAPTGGQQAISIAETPSSPWTGAFEAGGNISISSASGGAWFVTPGAPNAVAGPDKKVLIGQFTTDGDLSGQLLVQIFPEGVQVDEVQFEVSFSTPPCACTDATACNFDNDALYNDGTCEYADDFYGVDYLDCEGECLNDSDGDYVCDEDEVPGCLNPSACNYVDPSIVTDLVACQFPDFGYDCDGVCNNDADGDGVCDEFEVVDCTDMAACNYNSDSLVDTDNSLCIYPDAGYDCGGNCLTDTDGDGVCDEFEVNGCDDAAACNYDADATENNGSCDYCCHIGAAVSGYSVSVEEHGDSPEGTVYRMYVNTTGSNDFVSAITGTSAAPTMITTTQDFYQAPGYNSPFPTDFNAFVLGLIPELSYDSWVTIGLEMAGGAGEGGPDYVASTDWVQTFNAGGDIVMDSQYGDGWFVTINQSNGLAGDDNRVLVGQFTTNGVLSGELFVQIFPNSDQTSALELTLPFGWASENSGEAPVFTSVPADVALACTDGLPTEMATAEAVMCGGNTVVTFEDITVSGACAGSSTFERVFTATDGWGNTATASQFIELSDTEAPVAVAQADLVVECGTDITPGAGTAEFPTASYDDCAADLSYDYSDAPYTGSYDLTGATCDIRVEMGLDVPGLFGQPYVLEATGVTVGDGSELTLDDIVQNPVSHRGAIVVDIDGGAINLSFEGAVTPNTNSYQYDYARVIVSNMSADVSGVSVNSNGIAPGADLNAGLTADGFVIEWSGTAVYTEGETASLNAEDETTCLNNEGVVRTWTVSDDCGNESYAVQTIIFEDTTGPEFTSLPADMTHSCDESPEYGSAVAEDCEGSVAVTVSESTIAGSCAANMTIVRTFTATDNCGNTSVATQTIEVVDDSAPVFTFVPADATYDVGADIQDDLATAEDNCGGASVTFFDASDASAGTYTVITRTFVATDDCGNTAEATQLITVNEIVGCTDSTACNYNESATYEDGSCDFCSCGIGGTSGFGLELEVYAENGIPGMNTYRVYVTTPGPDDFISAVAGDVNNPAYLRTTTGFFQSQFGGLSAHEINPLFFAVLPSVMFDSWLTIGIDQAPNTAAGQSAITFAEYSEDSWTSDFEAGGDLEINSFFGGSWFALISATNGLAGEDNRVLVAQLTTDGDVTGELYVQVFPNGDQSQDTYLNLSFGGSECGCTDDMACNYDAAAIYDNGTCTYASDIYGSEYVDCDGVCFNDADGDGICDEEEVAGCTDASACNYDMDATDDNGTCEYLDVCTGCTDATACNYNMNAVEDDGSCEYPESGFDCEGNCLDVNSDLICDAIQGCDDPTACNYDPSVEQPSADFCDYCSCPNIETSNANYSIEIEEYAVDAVLGATTYRVYVTTANPTDALNAILGNESNPIVLGSSSQFFQDPAGDVFPTNPMMFGFTPQLEWDSYVTIGDNTPADVLDFPMASNGSEPAWLAEFEAGGSIVIDDEVGNGWYIEAGLGGQYGIAGDDNRVLVAQLTTPGTLFGSLYLQIFPEGQAADNTIYVAASFGDSRCGCTDEDACNYNGAGSDDGSCYYSDDCENSCLYDVSAPTIDAVDDYSVSCDEVETDIRQPEGSDNCDGDLSWSYTDAIELGSCDNAYTIIRTWTAMDNSGYTTSADQIITVEDNTAPTFSAPAAVEVACGSDIDDLTLTGDVTDAMDNCGDVTMSYSDANGTSNCFDGDVIIRTWTATDACGNTSSATQTIHLIDEVAPYFTSVPADISLSCGDALPTDMAEAADACSSVEVTVTETSGDVSCTGLAAVIRTFRATDGCGNFTTATQTITFVDDQAPSFTTPANADVACGGDASPEMTGVPSDLSDNCSGDLAVDYSDEVATSADGCFADDQIIRTWVVTDACGNSSESVQTIQFVDEMAPVMDTVEATIEITCGQEIPADMPGATDACSAVEVTFADAAGDVNCTGMAAVVRTFTATDACGNSTSATTTFVHTDNTAPTFTVPADMTVECSTDLNDLSIVGDVMNVEDNCAAAIDVDYTDSYSTSEGSCLADNIVTRTWIVTDGCGNASEAVQTITLEDTTAPEVNFEAVVNLTYYNGEQLPEFEGVTVNDACSDWDHETTDVYTSVNGFGYTLHRTIVVTDACGNSTTIEQDINVDLYGGCTYEEAFNFDPTAVLDDGSCEYAGCTDPAAANYDELFTIEDGSCLIVGCMDPAGLDYNPEATFPGGCDYPDPCPGDLNEDGNVNVGDLLEFFQLYGTVCE